MIQNTRGLLTLLMEQDHFIAGKHDFGTLIGLKQGKNLIGGVIDCPALNERWISFNDNLTTVNGIKAVCQSVEVLEDALMATTSGHEFGIKNGRLTSH